MGLLTAQTRGEDRGPLPWVEADFPDLFTKAHEPAAATRPMCRLVTGTWHRRPRYHSVPGHCSPVRCFQGGPREEHARVLQSRARTPSPHTQPTANPRAVPVPVWVAGVEWRVGAGVRRRGPVEGPQRAPLCGDGAPGAAEGKASMLVALTSG